MDISAGIIETVFLPTPSVRRATGIAIGAAEHRVISTHALREEGDRPAGQTESRYSSDFYPRPP